jgi:hypothetical protein
MLVLLHNSSASVFICCRYEYTVTSVLKSTLDHAYVYLLNQESPVSLNAETAASEGNGNKTAAGSFNTVEMDPLQCG